MQEVQKEQAAKDGKPYYDNDLVVAKPDGAPIAASWVSSQFGKLLEDLDMPHIRFHDLRHPYVKHTTKIFSLRLMNFQAQAYPDAQRKTRGACQLHQGEQSRSSVRPLCNRKQFPWLSPQSKMFWIQFSTFGERLRGECPFTYRRFWATFAPCFQQSGKSFFIFFIAAPMLLEIF